MRKALIALALVLWTVGEAQPLNRPGKGDWCYDPTRNLSVEDKKAYVLEIVPAAVAAENKWHVPAAIIAAMAIQESGFGTTRLALGSNNIFGYKWPGAPIAKGRRKFILTCQPDWDKGNAYIAFKTRFDAVDFVASRLAIGARYAANTNTYWRQITQAGTDRKAAALKWLRVIASSYNYRPATYIKAITRLTEDPLGDRSEDLWQLTSGGSRK